MYVVKLSFLNLKFINESFYNMRCLVMFITAVCMLFLLKLKWPKNKNFYDKAYCIVLYCQVLLYLLLCPTESLCLECISFSLRNRFGRNHTCKYNMIFDNDLLATNTICFDILLVSKTRLLF